MRISCVSIATLATMLAMPVHAQSTAARPSDAAQAGDISKDIIVTATRTETSLQRTPIAVTALSAETLNERGATSLLDVQNSTPSLTVGSRSTTGTSRGGFTIRGIGVDSTDGSSSVGIYVDDVYYPSGAGNLLGLFDVNRVEVLRGPQGTLFGRNTIAGAVQYITNKPSQVLGGYLAGTVGTYGHYEVSGALNLPISNTLAVRLSGRYNELGGFVKDDFNDIDRGAEKTKQGRAQLRWEPASNLTVDLKGEYIDQTSNGRALAVTSFNTAVNPQCTATVQSGCLAPGAPSSILVDFGTLFGFDPAQLSTIRPSGRDYHIQGFNSPDDSTFKYRSSQGAIAWDLTDQLRLKSISAYSYSFEDARIDLDMTPLPIFALDRSAYKTKLFTQEVQLSGNLLDDRLNFTVGGYYFNQKTNRTRVWQYPGLGVVVVPAIPDTNLKTVAKAAYGQLTFKFTDRLSATGGIRYSKEDVTGSYINTLAPGVGAPVVVGGPRFAPYSLSFDDVSPSFGLNFQVTPNKLIYIKASKGFRAGGLAFADTSAAPVAPAPAGYVQFDPETAWTYEAGTRLQFLDRRIRINPTIFYTDWKKIQFNTFVFVPAPLVVTQNAGSARIWGVELESHFDVSRQFSIDYNFSYLNSKYTSVLPNAPVTLASELQRTPPVKFSLGGTYHTTLANGDDVVANVNYSWNDKQRSATSNADFITIPAYGLLNARLGYTFKDIGLNVAVYGTNLTDKYYYVGGANGFVTFGGVEADLGRRREIGLSARLDF